MNFSDFALDERILEGIGYMGYKAATPIQEQAIPIVLEKKDLIACAQTGTGKTAAYLLPTIHNIINDNSPGIKALIVVPTRELALQISQVLDGIAYFTGIESMAIYGGGDGISFSQEKSAISTGSGIIIATPGRLLVHLTMGYARLENLRCLILDEADKMLEMGFIEDIIKIDSYLPKNKQTLMFSATMPPKIRTLAAKMLKDPKQISIAISKPAEGILQGAYLVYDDQKVELIKHLLENKKDESVIIFCSTKKAVDVLERELIKLRLSARAIHSDLEQREREEVLLEFRSGKTKIIVATDILSRGIDIVGINLVINYDVPNDAEDYVHRIGRTARADSTGVAITLINDKDQMKFKNIEDLIEKEIHKIPLPQGMKPGPAYEPEKKPPSFKKPHFKRKFRKK